MCAKETERILTKYKKNLLTMANVLIEKETIYAEEVDMIIDGKSKDEVIAHIESKDKKDDENQVKESETTTSDDLLKTIAKVENIDLEKAEENQEKIAKNTQENMKSVDDLIKEAEKREKELAQKQVKEDEKAEKKPVAKKTTTTAKKKTSTSTKKTTTASKSTTKKTSPKKKVETPATEEKTGIDKVSESDKIDTENKD